MHDASRQQGERAGDQQRADIEADHCPLVFGYVVSPCAMKRAEDPEQSERDEQMDRAQSEERTLGMI